MMKRLSLFLLSAAALFGQSAVVRDGCTAASASGTAYTCSYAVSPGLITNHPYWFRADVTNTGSTSITFNSLSTVTIKKFNSNITTNLVAGDICAGEEVVLWYDGTNMELISPPCTPAAGGGSVIPDVTKLILIDDFPGGTNTSDNTGTLNWHVSTGSGSPGWGHVASVANHPGIFQMVSDSGGSSSVILSLMSSESTPSLPRPDTATNAQFTWIFKLSSISNPTELSIGLGDNVADQTSNFLGLVVDIGGVGANMTWRNSPTGGTLTNTTTGVAADTAWHKIKVTMNGGVYTGCLDSCGSATTIAQTNGVISSFQFPMAWFRVTTSAARNVQIDYFSAYYESLSR